MAAVGCRSADRRALSALHSTKAMCRRLIAPFRLAGGAPRATSVAQQGLELFLVPREQTNPLGQLLGGHGVLVVRPAEAALVQHLSGLADGAGLQPALQRSLILGQLLQQLRAD